MVFDPEEAKRMRPFVEAFRAESDRACAVLARAWLEDTLRRLYSACFVPGTNSKDLLEGTAPLATFSARISVAAAFGLIPTSLARDLNIVRKIGNEFAHAMDHDLSFQTASIRDRVWTLRAPLQFLEMQHLADKPLLDEELQLVRTNPRRRFEVGVGIIQTILEEGIISSQPAQPKQSFLDALYKAKTTKNPSEPA